MFNNFTGIGNLTADPEKSAIPGTGTTVAKFSVAINSKFNVKEESRVETLFLNTVAFGKIAEACNTYLKKGSLVLVDGRLRENSWEKDGQKHKKLELIASKVKFLPMNGKEKGNGESVEETNLNPEDDDIPF
ncbi:MAG: single-stranded DNA-binding protein [Nitrospinota bacterium]|nr:single-stranded DNA-binding protein [Nitrospinota bacterium]